MAGLIYNAVDWQTTYNFKILRDGVVANPAPVRKVFVTIPGVDGALFINLEVEPRPISISGILKGTSQADMYTKLIGLENELIGSFSATPDPNYLSPARTVKTLVVPSFGGKNFPTCTYDGMEVTYTGRLLNFSCVVTVRFTQWRPFTT